MSNIDKQALRDIAEKTKIAGEAPVMPFEQRINALNDFMKHFTPATMLALLDDLEAAEQRNAELVHNHRVHAARLIDERGQLKQRIAELRDWNAGLAQESFERQQRIAELEAKLQTADKLQDSAFRHGLQHGFSYGQTNNQAGFEQCLAAYSKKWGDK
ncbi:ead/Ea22-like family protein [Citrobacter koseri]|uniref:ead/Ea22-like family protein n=1 Tax=Citrobacter koseri TaxID=545 RepID=UPI000DF0EEB6|nr:ead/Ea22-like family protein [Citrobacter koseri]STB39513.1 Uncharacterised protein [Citrobacter koseri]STB73839.1 Uncharacterised protein [Citrobacter koseri]